MKFGDGDAYAAIISALADAPKCVKHVGVNLVEPDGCPAFYEVAAMAFSHMGEWTKVPADATREQAGGIVRRFLENIERPRGVTEIKRKNREYLFSREFDASGGGP
jgi:hypothetical protein